MFLASVLPRLHLSGRRPAAHCLYIPRKSASFFPKERSEQGPAELMHNLRISAHDDANTSSRRTHELRPVLFLRAPCRPPPIQPCCDARLVSPC